MLVFAAQIQRLGRIDSASVVAGIGRFEWSHAQFDLVGPAESDGKVASRAIVEENLPDIVTIVEEERVSIAGPASGAVRSPHLWLIGALIALGLLALVPVVVKRLKARSRATM